MNPMKTLLVTILIAAGILVSVAGAGAPIGPPTAMVGEGKWAIGAEGAYEQLDMKASGRVVDESIPFFWTQKFEVDSLKSLMVFGNLAYGVCDTWDIFVRVGVADAGDEIIMPPADSTAAERRDDFDGSLGLAWGVGTRATFCRSGPWSVGGLMQVTWFQPGDSDFSVADPFLPDESWVGSADLDYWQAQVALAAAYQIDTLRLWGGPFLQFIEGNLDFRGEAIIEGVPGGSLTWSSDLEEASQLGGLFGASWAVTSRFNLWAEGQITSDSWLIGVGAIFLPEETFGLQ